MVKGARPDVLRLVAVRCRERTDSDFKGFWGDDCTLVPVPPSSPPRTGDTLWPGLDIAKELLGKGLARDMQAVIHKSHPWLEVVGFAAVRTMSFEVVTEPLAPAAGSVTLGQSGWGSREP